MAIRWTIHWVVCCNELSQPNNVPFFGLRLAPFASSNSNLDCVLLTTISTMFGTTWDCPKSPYDSLGLSLDYHNSYWHYPINLWGCSGLSQHYLGPLARWDCLSAPHILYVKYYTKMCVRVWDIHANIPHVVVPFSVRSLRESGGNCRGYKKLK